LAAGPVWTGVETLAPSGIRSPERPARNKSVYQPHIRPTTLRMSGATPLLPLYALKAWTENFFLRKSSSRNPSKGKLHNFSFKRMNTTYLFLRHRTKDGNTEHVGATLKFYNCIWDVSGSNVRRHTVYPEKISMLLFSPSRRIARECLENNTTTAIAFPLRLSPDIALSIQRYLRCWQLHEIYQTT